MPSITFIYKIGNVPRVYYGKYVSDYISDDHEGLDLQVVNSLVKTINNYRSAREYRLFKHQEVKVGVIGLTSQDVNDYCTLREIKTFDFYHLYDKVYLNGRVVTDSMTDSSYSNGSEATPKKEETSTSNSPSSSS